jgi:DNA polymerase III sliding clamp (beta) subunit (PCNA family)
MISLPTSILTAALAGLSKVCPRRSTLPILGRILIRQAGPRITLTASDLNATLTYTWRNAPEPITALARTLEALRAVREAEAMLVPVDALQAAVKGDKTGTVECERGGLRYALAGSPVSLPFDEWEIKDFPLGYDVQAPLQPLPDDARRGILDALLCASEDETRYILNGVFIGRESNPTTGEPYPPHEPHHVIVATDGKHLLRANSLHLPALSIPFVLPAFPVLKSAALAAHPWQLAVQPGGRKITKPSKRDLAEYKIALAEYERLSSDDPDLGPPPKPESVEEELEPVFRLEAGPWSLVGKTIGGNYPNYRQVIPDAFKLTVEIPPGSLPRIVEALPRLPALDANRAVALIITPKTGIAFSIGKNSFPVFAATVGAVSSDRTSLRITFNRDFLLKAFRFGLHTIHFTDDMSPAVFTAPRRQLVVMPMRTT